MARTAAGATLTRQHRRSQLQLRALALRDFSRIWPLWQGDRETFERLVAATVPLVGAHHRLSSALAAAYYETFRRAEQITGSPTPKLATLERGKVVSSLYVTGSVMTHKALLAGQPPQVAMQTALVRTAGAVTRHVLAGGRETLIESTNEDPRARGWIRVPGMGACAFCAMLASRGPVYSDQSVGFQAHDHCSCASEPVYDGSAWPSENRRYEALWQEHAKGEPDQLNAFRGALEGRRAPAAA